MSEKRICACSSTCGVIYLTDLDGHVIKKCGSKGQIGALGHFIEPRVCHGSYDGAVLVTDIEKNDLQALDAMGEWGRLQFEESLHRPACAVFIKRQLFVLKKDYPYTIFKYK